MALPNIERVTSHTAQKMTNALEGGHRRDLWKLSRSIYCQWHEDEKLLGLAMQALKAAEAAPELVRAIEMRLTGKQEAAK